MSYRKILQLFLFFLPLLSFGQQRWENVIYGDILSSIGNSLSYDRGQLLSAAYGGNGTHKSIIFKLDRNGDILWQKHLFYDNSVGTNGIKQNASGDIMIYGETDYKASLVYLDACGNLL